MRKIDYHLWQCGRHLYERVPQIDCSVIWQAVKVWFCHTWLTSQPWAIKRSHEQLAHAEKIPREDFTSRLLSPFRLARPRRDNSVQSNAENNGSHHIALQRWNKVCIIKTSRPMPHLVASLWKWSFRQGSGNLFQFLPCNLLLLDVLLLLVWFKYSMHYVHVFVVNGLAYGRMAGAVNHAVWTPCCAHEMIVRNCWFWHCI